MSLFAPGSPNDVNFRAWVKFFTGDQIRLFANTVVATHQWITAELPAATWPKADGRPQVLAAHAAAVPTYWCDVSRLPRVVDDAQPPPPRTPVVATAIQALVEWFDDQFAYGGPPPPTAHWYPVIEHVAHAYWDQPASMVARLSHGGRFFGSGASVVVEETIPHFDRAALCGKPAVCRVLTELSAASAPPPPRPGTRTQQQMLEDLPHQTAAGLLETVQGTGDGALLKSLYIKKSGKQTTYTARFSTEETKRVVTQHFRIGTVPAAAAAGLPADEAHLLMVAIEQHYATLPMWDAGQADEYPAGGDVHPMAAPEGGRIVTEFTRPPMVRELDVLALRPAE